MAKVKVTKADVYHLELPHSYQCDIIIETLYERCTRIIVVSEFGNWAQTFSHSNTSLADFLGSLEMEYLATKVGEKKTRVSPIFQKFWEIAWTPFVEYLTEQENG